MPLVIPPHNSSIPTPYNPFPFLELTVSYTPLELPGPPVCFLFSFPVPQLCRSVRTSDYLPVSRPETRSPIRKADESFPPELPVFKASKEVKIFFPLPMPVLSFGVAWAFPSFRRIQGLIFQHPPSNHYWGFGLSHQLPHLVSFSTPANQNHHLTGHSPCCIRSLLLPFPFFKKVPPSLLSSPPLLFFFLFSNVKGAGCSLAAVFLPFPFFAFALWNSPGPPPILLCFS